MNIALIGMSGAGKSFVGRMLADKMGYTFLDIDQCIVLNQRKQTLQEVLEELGDEAFLRKEAEILVRETTNRDNLIISPGGSVVYTAAAMKRLKNISFVVYLHAQFSAIQSRIGTSSRGIVGLEKKSLNELYAERVPLYEQYADAIFDAGENPEKLVRKIMSLAQIRAI